MIDNLEQASALLKPTRVELLRLLAGPGTCPELAESLGATPQKVYYHVKVLERAGLVRKVEERRVGGIMEGVYQAVARSYWVSPRLVGRLGGATATRERLSLESLLDLMEDAQVELADVARNVRGDLPTLGLAAQIELPDESAREAFMNELRDIFESLARKYGQRSGAAPADGPAELFRLVLACFPKEPAASKPRPKRRKGETR
jgi:DNA-binding transcriptional ArsR family regulator